MLGTAPWVAHALSVASRAGEDPRHAEARHPACRHGRSSAHRFAWSRRCIRRAPDRPRPEARRHARRPCRAHPHLEPARPGWTAVQAEATASIVAPELALGARGPSVRELERRLAELHYAIPRDGYFGSEDLEAVYAFQKVEGLARTGVVTPSLWARLFTAPRSGATLRRRRPRRDRQDAAGAVPRPRRPGLADRRDLDGRDRQHAARDVARLPEGDRVRLGALLPELLPGRLCDPRLSGRAAVPGVARVRAHPDVDREDGLRADLVRQQGDVYT